VAADVKPDTQSHSITPATTLMSTKMTVATTGETAFLLLLPALLMAFILSLLREGFSGITNKKLSHPLMAGPTRELFDVYGLAPP